MTVTRQSLLEHFQVLKDGELLAQFRSGELTALAQSVAAEELHRRGIEASKAPVEIRPKGQEALDTETLVPIARFFTVVEADMLQSRLEADGVPAVVADAQTVQANPLLAVAIGGVRVLVPESYVDRARAIVGAVDRGDYALDDDTDTA